MRAMVGWMFFFISSAVSAQGVPGVETGRVDIGNGWTLLTYQKRDGGFSHCSVVATYVASSARSRRLMRARELDIFLVSNNGRLGFGIEAYDWNITPGEKYRLDLHFDRQHYFIDAEGYTETKIQVGFKFDAQWLDKFGGARTLSIKVNGRSLGSYNLSGSRNASLELLNCVSRNSILVGNGGSTVSADTFGGVASIEGVAENAGKTDEIAPRAEIIFADDGIRAVGHSLAVVKLNEKIEIASLVDKFSRFKVQLNNECEGTCVTIIGEAATVNLHYDAESMRIHGILAWCASGKGVIDLGGVQCGSELSEVSTMNCEQGEHEKCPSAQVRGLYYIRGENGVVDGFELGDMFRILD